MKPKKLKIKSIRNFLFFVVILIGLSAGVSLWLTRPAVAAWYQDSWGFRKKLTIDKSKVSGGSDLTNFPILVSLTDGSLSKAQSTGNDILFTDNTGSVKLDHEIEKFTQSNGTLVAWVRIPTLHYQTDDVIYLYYGNASSPAQQNKTGVWDSNYVAVYHLSETSGHHLDSKGSNNTTSESTTQQGTATGKANGADEFNGTSNLLGIADNDSLSFPGDFTVEAWAKLDQLALARGEDSSFVAKKHLVSPWDEYDIRQRSWSGVDYLEFNWTSVEGGWYEAQSSVTPVARAWYHVAGVKVSNLLKIYVNGTSTDGQTVSGTSYNSTDELHIGADYSGGARTDGIVDEIRISDIARPAGWIATTYNTISNNAAFFSAKGNEEQNRQPVLNFNFDEGTGTTVNDSSPNRLIGTLSGATEMILNPGFETAGGGGADVFANWTEAAGNGAIANEGSIVHGGTHAAKLTAGADLSAQISQTFTVIPGATYTLTFWNRSSDGVHQNGVYIYDTNDWSHLEGSSTIGNQSSYTPVTRTFRLPAGHTQVQIVFIAGWYQGDIGYFDDVSLKPNLPTWATEDQCVNGKCISLNGVDNSITVATSIPNIQTVSMWVRPITNGESILDLDGGSHKLTASNGTITATGFTTLYVNGQVGNTLTANQWQHLEATTATPFTASNIKIGNVASAYLHGYIDSFKLYDYARTPAQVKTDAIRGAAPAGSAAVLGTNQAGAGLSNGLIAWWKMDDSGIDAEGEISSDSSGNGNNGTLYGDNGVGDNGTGMDCTTGGKFGTGCNFDGTDDYVDAGSNSTLKSTNEVTLSTWIKRGTATGAQETIIGGDAYDSKGYIFYLINLHVYFRINKDNTSQVTFDLPNDTNWHQITGVRSPNSLTLYLDGVQKAQVLYTAQLLASDDNLYIGNEPNRSYYFSGSLDDVRIYNRALSPAEVTHLYNWAPGPVGYWKMDENTGQTVNDSSGNNFNGYLGTSSSVETYDPTWTTGKFGSALNFNGSSSYVSNVMPFSNGTITTEAWFYPRSYYTTRNYDPDWNNNVITAFTSDSALLTIYNGKVGGAFTCDYNNQVASARSSNNISLNAWHHAAYTYDGHYGRIYIDGVLSATSSLYECGYSDVQTGISIGRSEYSSGSQYFDGLIDEVKYYNYPRTSAQIIQDMNAGLPAGALAEAGHPGSAYIHYNFDEGYSTIAHNLGNGGSTLNGTIGSGTWTNNGKLGKAVTFTASTSVTATITDPAYTNTVSVWVYPTTSAASKTLVTAAKLTTDSSSRPVYGGCTGTALSLSTWTHLVAVSNSSTSCALYQNGVLTSSAATGVTFGTSLNLGGSSFVGSLDEFKLYNFALTADQVKLDYNQGKSQILGSTGTTSTNSASNAAVDAYCPPGQGTTCVGPVGEWKLDENTSTTANDTSGNSLSGSLGGGTTANQPIWSSGKSGSALKFDGVDDYVSVNDNDLLSFGNGTSDSPFSVSAWIYMVNPSLFAIVDKMPTSAGGGEEWQFYTYSDNTLNFQLNDANNSNWIDVYSTAALTSYQNQWAHVTATYNGSGSSGIKLYVNGTQVTTSLATQGSYTAMHNSTGKLYIGGDYVSDVNNKMFANGKIDQVNIYNYVRTAAQVAWDYNRGAPVAWYKFDECSGTILHNVISTSYPGTIYPGNNTGNNDTVGSCSDGLSNPANSMWNAGTSGKYSSSLSFDGTNDYVEIADNANLDLNLTQISIAFWVKLTTAPTWKKMLAKSYSNGSNISYMISLSGSSPPNLELALAFETGSCSIISNSGFPTGVWTHVIGTWDGTNIKMYLNGIQQTQVCIASKAHIRDTASNLVFGQSTDFLNPITGQMDDVRIYNYGLTAEQVKLLYNNNSAVSF